MAEQVANAIEETELSAAELEALDGVDSLFDDLDDELDDELVAAELEDELDAASVDDESAADVDLDAIAGLDDELDGIDESLEAESEQAEEAPVEKPKTKPKTKASEDAEPKASTSNRPSASLEKVTTKTLGKKAPKVELSSDGATPLMAKVADSESLSSALAVLASNGDKSGVQSHAEDMFAKANVLPKKVQEKLINILDCIAHGKTLSPYTAIAIGMLADGSLTRKALVDKYKAQGYSDGTAGAQASQMMKLLPIIGVATGGAAGMTLIESDAWNYLS